MLSLAVMEQDLVNREQEELDRTLVRVMEEVHWFVPTRDRQAPTCRQGWLPGEWAVVRSLCRGCTPVLLVGFAGSTGPPPVKLLDSPETSPVVSASPPPVKSG